MIMLLSALAHNVIVWARQWLSGHCPPLRHYGIVRMVRDVFHVSGFVVRDAHGQMVQLVLNRAAPLAPTLAVALHTLLAPRQVVVRLGET